MKKMIYSFIAVVTSICCLCSFTVSAADLVASDIYGNTIFNEDMRTAELGEAIASEFIVEYIKDGLEEMKRELDGDYSQNPFINIPFTIAQDLTGEYLNDFTISDFQYLCGKTKIRYYEAVSQSSEHWVNVRIDILYCSAYKYDYNKWIKWSDGVSVPINCLVYTITHEDGTTSRYYLRLKSQSSAPWTLAFTINDNADYFSLPQGSYDSTVYAITGDKTSVPVSWTYTAREKRVKYNTTNSIIFDIPTSNHGLPIKPRYPSVNGGFSDQEIINGYLNFYPSNDSSYWWADSYDFYVSYFSSNRTDDMNWISNTALTAPNQQNYYYQDTFKYGDVINNNNSDTIYSGSFDTIFNDVDLGDVDFDTLIPQITAGLQPTLQLGLDGLLDALMDFFGDMPDIGLTWDSDTSNNYYDIIPLEPEYPPTTGDINITIDITRPDVDAPDTSPNVSVYVPTVTTTALPPSVIQAGAKFVEVGKDMTDMIGITSTIVWLGLAGVGVMLVFKEW